MPPKGGARKPTKLMATSTTNPDDIKTFESLTAAAKGLNAPGHSTVKLALAKGEPVNGYTLTLLQQPASITPTEPVEPSASIPPQSPQTSQAQHDEFTFFDEVDDLFKGQKIRYTKEQPIQVSVFDIIRVVTGNEYPQKTFSRLQLQHVEVMAHCHNRIQFSGSGERLTPVCGVQTMIELINVLPGERAAKFRQAGAKVLVRVLGGDETLIKEIKENAQKMNQILTADDAASNPMSLFQLPDGLTGVNATCSLMLSPSMEGKTVADFCGTPCIYIILFMYCQQVAIKFGWTKNLRNRIREHHRMYPEMKIWFAIECKSIECAEAAEALFKGKMQAYLQTIQLETKSGPNKTSTEVLINVTPEKAEEVMMSAYETVCEKLSKDNLFTIKKLELENNKLNLENERLRLFLELKKLGVDPHIC
jgi:hypothetical protein